MFRSLNIKPLNIKPLNIRELNLSWWKFGRLSQLMALNVSVMIYSVLMMAIANSLFLSNVGSGQLPIAFIIIGLMAVPAYTLFSHVVDQLSRTQMFQVMLLVSIVISLILRAFCLIDSPIIFYLITIVAFFQWDFHNSILYPNLLIDYFSTQEYKRYIPLIGMAQAVGTLVGGTITIGLVQILSTQNLLLCLPLVYGIALLQVWYLGRTQRRLEDGGNEPAPESDGFVATLKSLPGTFKRHPLALYLAASSFLLVSIYLSSEFLWLSIYSERFQTDALTKFLGTMRIAVSVVQLATLYLITRPLLQWLGVARMNVAYPLTTLAALLGLVFNLDLRFAVVAHMNGDALYKSINIPVHQLNYNGIPRRLSGQIRALSDGVFFALGQVMAGILLLVANAFLSLPQIAAIAMALTIVLLVVIRLPMGGYYARGLENMIRVGAIDLEEFEETAGPLPTDAYPMIHEYLQAESLKDELKGLELAAIAGHPDEFWPDVKALLGQAETFSAGHQRAMLHWLHGNLSHGLTAEFEQLLQSAHFPLRQTALIGLIVNHFKFDPTTLAAYLGDSRPEIRALATVAVTLTVENGCEFEEFSASSSSLQEAIAQLSQLAPADATTVIQVMSICHDPVLISLLEQTLKIDDDEIQTISLAAIALLVSPGDAAVAQGLAPYLQHPSPSVRMATLKILGIIREASLLSQLERGLNDTDCQVRSDAARLLANYGPEGLTLATQSLASTDVDVVRAAIAAIGQVKTKQANHILYQYLTPDFQLAAQARRWRQQIPAQRPAWELLAIAIDDYHQRLIQKVLYVLECLGYERTVKTVRQLLKTSNQQEFENAVEVLGSLPHRRFVLPLLPLLEQNKTSVAKSAVNPFNPQWLRKKGHSLLLNALEASDRWIRTGALVALSSVPQAMTQDTDPIVQTVAQQIFTSRAPIQTSSQFHLLTERLLLLRQIRLFDQLTLDDLYLVDKMLTQETIAAGDTIFAPEQWDDHVYILATGTVQVVEVVEGLDRANGSVKAQVQTRQLEPGQAFSQMPIGEEVQAKEAIAQHECVVLKIEKAHVLNFLKRPLTSISL